MLQYNNTQYIGMGQQIKYHQRVEARVVYYEYHMS